MGLSVAGKTKNDIIERVKNEDEYLVFNNNDFLFTTGLLTSYIMEKMYKEKRKSEALHMRHNLMVCNSVDAVKEFLIRYIRKEINIVDTAPNQLKQLSAELIMFETDVKRELLPEEKNCVVAGVMIDYKKILNIK